MIKPKGVNYMINWYRLPHILDFDLLENLVDKPDLSLERMHTDMNLGYQICFGKGKFDEWCAFTKYRGNSGMMLYAMPRDVDGLRRHGWEVDVQCAHACVLRHDC